MRGKKIFWTVTGSVGNTGVGLREITRENSSPLSSSARWGTFSVSPFSLVLAGSPAGRGRRW